MSDPRSESDRFEYVVRTYGAALSRLAWAYAADADDRDDLVQEILVAVWRALPRFRGECSERTFVFRVAHNRGTTAASRRRVSRPLEDAAGMADPGPDAATTVARDEERERLMAAIKRLPEMLRQAVLLHLEGLTAKEIADVQGTTENNVGVRLARARKALRLTLGDEEATR